MRKILLLSIIIILSGCAGYYKRASYVSNKSYIGMPLSEFKSISGKKAILESIEKGYTVYRISDFDIMSGMITDVKFYYFGKDNKLFKIDNGQLEQDRQTNYY